MDAMEVTKKEETTKKEENETGRRNRRRGLGSTNKERMKKEIKKIIRTEMETKDNRFKGKGLIKDCEDKNCKKEEEGKGEKKKKEQKEEKKKRKRRKRRKRRGRRTN